MKRVYIVTSGDYSDYRIEKVFSNRSKAHIYSLLDQDRRVEEYDVDDLELNVVSDYLFVSYDYKYNDILELTLCGEQVKPRISEGWRNPFEFTLSLSDDRIYRNLMRYGKNSKVILKIAQDKFAEYCYERNTSREELIRERDGKYYNPNSAFYSTSSSFDNSAYRQRLVVNERVATALKQMIVDGKQLPPVEELQTIYDVTASDVEKENEQD
jgi:hypothetical protein